MDLNKGYAVTLPNSTPSTYEVMQDIQRRQDFLKQQQLAQQQREQARQASLTQMVGQTFDPKDFDMLEHNELMDARNKYAKIIQQNPGLSQADLFQMMGKDLSGIQQKSQLAGLAREKAKSVQEAYKQYKGINAGDLSKVAMNRMLFQTGEDGKIKYENGRPVWKNPEDINVENDYASEELGRYPELYLTKDADAMEELGKAPTAKLGRTYKYINPRGGYSDNETDFEYYQPYQKVADEPTEGAKVSRHPRIVPRSEVIDLGNGKQLEVADDVAYKHYMSDPQLKATLDKRFKERYGADPSSPAAEPYKRAMILDDIKQITPKSEKIKNLTKDNPVIRVNVNTGGAKGDKPSFTPEDVILQTATGKGDFGREDVDGRVELIDEIGKGYKIRVPGVDHLVNATSIKWDKKHPENGIQIDGSYEGYDKQTHFLERPMDIPLENLPEFVKQAARVNTSGRNYIKSEKKVDSYQKDVEDAKKKSGNDNFMSRWMQLFFKQKP